MSEKNWLFVKKILAVSEKILVVIEKILVVNLIEWTKVNGNWPKIDES